MNNVLTEKRAELKKVLEAIEAKQAEISGFEYESSEDDFDSYLDYLYSEVEICGSTFSASYALKNLDPTAYRCAKADYDSAQDLDDVPEYAALVAELEDLDNERVDLEVEIEDLENEEEESEE